MSIDEIIKNCEKYLIKNEYKSYDQFDALTNPLINRLTKNKQLARRIAIQVVAKFPFDLHWLGMKKMLHTKTISDMLWFYSIEKGIDASNEINHFFELLIQKKLKDRYIWGLTFPYTSRFIDADASMPNLYNTVNAGISICYSFLHLKDPNKQIAKEAINGIIHSIETEFGYIDEDPKGWYIYYPGQKHPVYNVNALTIYFLVFVKKLGLNDLRFLDKRIKSLIHLLAEEQENDGSWFYSRSDKGKWIDGFHTGFILESLAFAHKEGYAKEIAESLHLGWDFYLKKMFTKEGYSKYYLESNKFPIESQNYAQTIQTLSNISKWLKWDQKDLLNKTINIVIKNLYDKRGFFYYKKTKFFIYKQPFLRWSVTPMMIALSYSKQLGHYKN